jgi:dephospho-CoA kinase
MFCIGLTGTIASGKSTVAKQFEALGIDIINADHIARSLVEPGKPAFQDIVKHFGTSILTDNSTLNRAQLRQRIASNPVERAWLEALLHPLIREQIQLDITQCKSPYCVIEIPLLTDKAAYPYLNRVLLVCAPPEKQIKRLIERDHCTRNDALAMLATTKNDDEKRRAIADEVFVNNGSIKALQNKVIAFHDLITKSL